MRDPKAVKAEEREGKHHSKVACELYKKQAKKGKNFLHEHPEGASSWKTDDVESVKEFDGTRDVHGNEIRIYVVKGPMCHWG